MFPLCSIIKVIYVPRHYKANINQLSSVSRPLHWSLFDGCDSKQCFSLAILNCYLIKKIFKCRFSVVARSLFIISVGMYWIKTTLAPQFSLHNNLLLSFFRGKTMVLYLNDTAGVDIKLSECWCMCIHRQKMSSEPGRCYRAGADYAACASYCL